LLKNPWNLSGDQKERLSTSVRWNAPIVRAYYLKEAFQLFWFYKQPKRAKDHLEKWMRSAMSSRLEPFKKFGSAQESDNLPERLAFSESRPSLA
jgi:transposase